MAGKKKGWNPIREILEAGPRKDEGPDNPRKKGSILDKIFGGGTIKADKKDKQKKEGGVVEWLDKLREERKKKYGAPAKLKQEGSILDMLEKKGKKAKYEDGGVVVDEPLLGKEHSEEEIKKKAKIKALLKIKEKKKD